MKKTNVADRINGAIAKGALVSARAGAGYSSLWGWHQPKVPQRISK